MLIKIKNLILLYSISFSYTGYSSYFSYSSYLKVNKKCEKAGLFALTFDDGVTKNYDTILDILSKEKIKATFFVVGETLNNKNNASRLKKAYEQGHQVANHSWSHPRFLKLSCSQIEKEITDTQNALNKIIPIPFFAVYKKYIRTPYGEINQKVGGKLKDLNYSIVFWNIDPKDWNRKHLKEYIWMSYQTQMNNADPRKDSFIAVHHDKNIETVKILPELIHYVKAKGFRFVTISECLKKI